MKKSLNILLIAISFVFCTNIVNAETCTFEHWRYASGNSYGGVFANDAVTLQSFGVSGDANKYLGFCRNTGVTNTTKSTSCSLLNLDDKYDVGIMAMLNHANEAGLTAADVSGSSGKDNTFRAVTTAIRLYEVMIGGSKNTISVQKGDLNGTSNGRYGYLGSWDVVCYARTLATGEYREKLISAGASPSYIENIPCPEGHTVAPPALEGEIKSVLDLGLSQSFEGSSSVKITGPISKNSGSEGNYVTEVSYYLETEGVSIASVDVQTSGGLPAPEVIYGGGSNEIKLIFRSSECRVGEYTMTIKYASQNGQQVGGIRAYRINRGRGKSQGFYAYAPVEGDIRHGSVNMCALECGAYTSSGSCSGGTSNIDTVEGLETDGGKCGPAVGFESAPTSINALECVIDNQDIAGNTFKSPQVDNKYCSLFCKEDYQTIMPGVRSTNSGRYFTLEASIKGRKSCYTSEIKKEQFLGEMNTIESESEKAFNIYKAFQHFTSCPSHEETDEDNWTCINPNTGAPAATTGYCPDNWKSYGTKTVYECEWSRDTTDVRGSFSYLGASCSGGTCSYEGEDDPNSDFTSARTSALNRINTLNTQFNENKLFYEDCTKNKLNDIDYKFEPSVTFWYNESYMDNMVNAFETTSSGVSGTQITAYSELDQNDKSYNTGTVVGMEEIEERKEWKIYNSERLRPKEETTADIYKKKWIKFIKTADGSYVTPTQAVNIYTSGAIAITDGEEVKNGHVLENALPVGLGTVKGTYDYTIKVDNLGEFYDSGSTGRIYGGSNSVVVAAFNNQCIAGGALVKDHSASGMTDGLYVCKYEINPGDNDKKYKCSDFEFDRNRKKWVSKDGREEKSIEEYERTCGCKSLKYDDKIDRWVSPDGELVWTHGKYLQECCKDCPVECENCTICDGEKCTKSCNKCIYNDGHNFTYRQITTNDINPNNRTMGVNWKYDEKSISTALELKAYATVKEIVTDYGEAIYDFDSYKDVAVKVHMNGQMFNTIKKYNKDNAKNGGYYNTTLDCYDYKDGNTTYKNIYCYSKFIDMLIDTHPDNIKFTVARPKSEAERKNTQNSKYFITWTQAPTNTWSVSTTRDLSYYKNNYGANGIGPSWK